MDTLPVEAVLPTLKAALEAGRNAVLAAPPGAGKTTLVPLALMEARWARGRILVLEPRRIAARAAAERMAQRLGERVGERVGYRIRAEARPGARVEVVTEGVLTRMLQSAPDLPGIACVVFDEIHERSIHSDLGLALCLEVQGALRPDLRLLAMSATLDTGLVGRAMGNAPVVESAGRLHPVETRWLGRPLRRDTPLAEAAAALIRRALAETGGDVLAFLPGAGEIGRVAARLADAGPEVLALHGSLPFAAQRRVLRAGAGRRIVLATAIAETSLTVEGVRVVVDCGRARRARVDPATGLGRLVTVPVSRAEADQRRGRAGRLGPGICYRMWARGEDGALPPFAPPEIAEADLSALALELALWGAAAEELAFLTPPPAARLGEARRLLTALGALDTAGRITAHGREMAAQPLHPRLAHMLLRAGDRPTAAALAAILTEGDPLRGMPGTRTAADIALRLPGLGSRDPAFDRVRREAKRLGGGRPDPAAAGRVLALAYPDRIAQRRPGDAPRYLLASGRGAILDPGDGLAGQRLLVAADLEDGREARIRLAAALAPSDPEALFGDSIARERVAEWSAREKRVLAVTRRRLGALVLDERPWRDAPPAAVAAAMAAGVRALGLASLPWAGRAERLRARVTWLRQRPPPAPGLPDWSDAALLATLDDWLAPHLGACRGAADLAGLDLAGILAAGLDPAARAALDRAAPDRFRTPLGRTVVLDYSGEVPRLSVRLQEMFGVTRHPVAGAPPVPLLVELLSPAGRPVQATRDLPGFWAGSYADVRKEMRARYPKHAWPEDPAAMPPASRSGPRR